MLSDLILAGTYRGIAKLSPAPPGPDRPPARALRKASARRPARTGLAQAGPCGTSHRLLRGSSSDDCRRSRPSRARDRRGFGTSRCLVPLALDHVDLPEKLQKIFGYRFLDNVVIHPAQFAPDCTLPRPGGNCLFFVRLFLFHVQLPTLTSYGRSVPIAPVHAISPL